MTDNGVTKHIVPMNIIKIDGEYKSIPNEYIYSDDDLVRAYWRVYT